MGQTAVALAVGGPVSPLPPNLTHAIPYHGSQERGPEVLSTELGPLHRRRSRCSSAVDFP